MELELEEQQEPLIERKPIPAKVRLVLIQRPGVHAKALGHKTDKLVSVVIGKTFEEPMGALTFAMREMLYEESKFYFSEHFPNKYEFEHKDFAYELITKIRRGDLKRPRHHEGACPAWRLDPFRINLPEGFILIALPTLECNQK